MGRPQRRRVFAGLNPCKKKGASALVDTTEVKTCLALNPSFTDTLELQKLWGALFTI